MKKHLFLLAIIVCVANFVQAGEVTVKGDSTRTALVTELINNYFPGSYAVAVVGLDKGEYVIVTGAGGSERIHFSPKLVGRLQKLSANPQAGDGLMNICPTQARQLGKAVGLPSSVVAIPNSKSHYEKQPVGPCGSVDCPPTAQVLTGAARFQPAGCVGCP